MKYAIGDYEYSVYLVSFADDLESFSMWNGNGMVISTRMGSGT